MSPAEYIEQLQKLNFHEIIQDTLEESKQVIVQAQVQQMNTSKLSTGAPILPKYSPAYARKKGYSDPDLRLTGEFQSEVFADIRENIVVIDSADDTQKVQNLIDHYGEDIFGLNEDGVKSVLEVAGPLFYEKVAEQL